MATTTTVEFGRVAPRSGMTGDDYRGKVLHLPDAAMVVVVEARRGEDWWCGVLARRVPVIGAGHVRVSTARLVAGESVMNVDQHSDGDGYAMAWRARVWTRWPGGRMPMLARVLVEDARTPGGVDVVLTGASRARAFNSAHLRSHGPLRMLLERLRMCGFLSAMHLAEGGVEGYTLTIPRSTVSVVDT